MMTMEVNTWCDVNQRYLTAALADVREALERHISRQEDERRGHLDQESARHAMDEWAAPAPAPPALVTLCRTFGLSGFERDVLLLCAGIELGSDFASLCARAHGAPERRYPTFGLALAALPEAHWNALNSGAALRRWRLIELESGRPLTQSPLRIDERVLHYLTGIQYMDERLVGLVEPVKVSGELVPSHRALAERIANLWSLDREESVLPVVQLIGPDRMAKRAVAAEAATRCGLDLKAIDAYAIPLNASELEALIRLWEREAALSPSALLLDGDDADAPDAVRDRAMARIVQETRGPVLWSCRQPRPIWQRPILTVDVRKPKTREQQSIWRTALDATAHGLNGQIDRLVSQFSLSPTAVQAAVAEAVRRLPVDQRHAPGLSPKFETALWDACREQARRAMDELAQRIDTIADWHDLVLPEAQGRILHQIVMHVCHRVTVYETWGFAKKCARGLGISALFVGPSGTGKTLAAEILGHELRLDVYRIDLSTVVSKYIGETEKNLRRVFESAEDSGAILLFDEADALFGKRSEVKDSHDRYANIEINYLLQRLETYRGLAILTTNMKSALDPAFMRRIRFVVEFPFPDAAQREEIWRRMIPTDTPTEHLDMRKLARLNVTGGNIRNIALNAAFLAAEARQPVRMEHLREAARTEFAKLEKTLNSADVCDWGSRP